MRASRVEPALEVGFGAPAPPDLVVAEAAGDPGPDPFTAPVAVDLGVSLALLPLPPADPAVFAAADRPHSAADRAAAGVFGYDLLGRRDRGQRLTLAVISAAALQTLGPEAALADLEDGNNDGRDDDGRFTLAVGGSAVCITLGPERPVARALDRQTDPGDGLPASGYSWDPYGPCNGTVGAGAAAGFHGGTPGIYGASASGEVCDVGLLVDLLNANPPAAEAWALVHGLEPGGLAGYAAGLTPVVLLEDILVTDHGYRSGKISARRAVLQRGTAVLVDGRGLPVARCLSGSPLLPARALAGEFEVDGRPWPGFDPLGARAIAAAERPLEGFLLAEVVTGLPLRRLPGEAGAQPGLAGAVVAAG